MIKLLQSITSVAALFLVVWSHPASADAQPRGVQIGTNLLVEPVSAIDTQELWHLGAPRHVFSNIGKPPGGAIGVWEYGSESTLRDGAWIAVCLVMDGFGDISETPVALRIWSRTPGAPTIAERPPGPGRVVSFEIAIGQDRFVLSHTQAGAVFVNEHAIGEIR